MTRPLTVVLLAVLLTACAGASGPSDFRQAAMSPPRPPAVRPAVNDPYFPTPGTTPQGAGAYRGEPLPTRPVPRTKDKRILPASNEPRIYAADEAPRPIVSGPLLFGLVVPLPPEEAEASEETLKALRQCTEALDEASSGPDAHTEIMALPETARQCAAARAVSFCVSETLIFREGDRRSGVPVRQDEIDGLREALEHAQLMVHFNCENVEWTKDHARRLELVLREWAIGVTRTRKAGITRH